MNYCTKCGKPTNNEIVCEDCIILDSPWLLAMKSKENNLVEQIEQLKSENAELRVRLDKAVELPYERKRLLWGDKDKETLLCPDCLTDIMGGIGDETFVVQCPNCGCFVNSAIEPIEFTAATEARLKEIKERK